MTSYNYYENTKWKTKYPLTMLELLGREWHAEYYVDRVVEGCVGAQTAYLRNQATLAVNQVLSYDY